jgi:anti-sigma B factor antagonist
MNTTLVTLEYDKILEEQQINSMHTAIIPVIDKNAEGELILNFSNVQFMSSSLLGLLVKIHKRVCERGGHLKLMNVNANIYKVFEITRLTKTFDIVPSS